MSSFSRLSEASRSLTVCLVIGLPALFAAAPAGAWNQSCTALCNAAQAFQSYGTGPDDGACLAACNSGTSDCYNAALEDLWQLYLGCVDGGTAMEICRQRYADAKECSVCMLGEVAPWGLPDVFFVNEPACNPNNSPDGTLGNPFCELHHGIQAAIGRQNQDRDAKVVVCEGLYREGYDQIDGLDASAPGTAKVVVEAVIRDNAVISGSKDWSGLWTPQPELVSETVHNELRRSNQLTHSLTWPTSGVSVASDWIPDPPSVVTTAPPTKVHVVSADSSGALDPMIWQDIPYLPDKLVTFSAYLRPGAARRFMFDLRISDTLNTHTGAYYNFQLPPGQPCADDVASGAAGFGIEDAGNGWYRVHLTQSVDTDLTDPPPNGALYGVVQARLHLVGPLQAGDGAEVYGPQLDHRPLDQFETTPRQYLQTNGGPVQATIQTVKEFYGAQLWTHDWGLGSHHPLWGELPPVMRRSEMVFVDDALLRQELSIVDMEPGSFIVDDGIVYGGFNHKEDRQWVAGACSPQAPCNLRILPPEGIDLNEALVEVAVQPRLLWLDGLRDWEVRGLHFQHATGAYDSDLQESCPPDCIEPSVNSAVVFTFASDLTVLENRFDWNRAYGFGVFGKGQLQDSNVELTRNAADDNGTGGEYMADVREFAVTGEELRRNNWAGRRAGVHRHATTGAKYSKLANGSFRGVSASDNYGHGLWFDWENQAVSVLDCFASGNTDNGIYFEANDNWPPPAVADPTSEVKYSQLIGNGIGVKGISSSAVVLSDNIFIDNHSSAISLDATPRGQGSATKYLRDWTIQENYLAGSCPHHLWLNANDSLGQTVYTEWQPFMESMDSDDNDYAHALGAGFTGFLIREEEIMLQTWQTCSQPQQPWCFLTQDVHSKFIP